MKPSSNTSIDMYTVKQEKVQQQRRGKLAY